MQNRRAMTLLAVWGLLSLAACGNNDTTVVIQEKCAREHFLRALQQAHLAYTNESGDTIAYNGAEVQRFKDVYAAHLEWFKRTPIADLCGTPANGG